MRGTKAVIIDYTMVVALIGENSFALHNALSALVDNFANENGDMSIERLDGEEVALGRMQESLRSLPFLSARKLVVLRAPSANKQFIEQVEHVLCDIDESTEVIIVEPKVDKRSSYYKFLKKYTECREFVDLDDSGLAGWAVEIAKEQGGTLSAADARYLIARVGADQQLLAGEINKLLLYSSHITRNTIDLLVEPAPQSQVFDLLEAAFAGDMDRSLSLYRDQRAQKVDPAQIIAMLTWQLKVLALINTASGRTPGDIAVAAKLSPYTVQKSMAIARRLSLSALKRLIAELLRIDARSKRASIDLDEAMQNYLLAIGRFTQ